MTERNASCSMERLAVTARNGRCLLAAVGLFALGSAAQAAVLSREPDAGDLRLGQRVRVDDGTCAAGQIKEVSGAKMTETGVVRSRKCVPRVGPKTK